ncbi:juvenile hormone esterase-like [Atheta coriaria]|uniref:juvenile hormone esterase-like n=1 Tax=Dalotia coriaria TaxID=877792 RepID=UPI0031F339EE
MVGKLFFVIFAFFVVKSHQNLLDLSLVDVPEVGLIKGLVKYFETNKSQVYYQYKGIPYAEPPERFTISQVKEPWLGIHDGTVEGNVCPQSTGDLSYTGQFSEDCLVLTVTTPLNPNNFTCTNTTTSNIPVLVFVHGGFYAFGSAETKWYDPELLVQENILVVQIQYRLSAFGYITDGKIIPKNIGLKDIRLALQWVKKNIGSFGGDSNMITIHGESAGAMALSAIYQSPRTSHLCNNIIMQSGNIISPLAMNKNPKQAFHTLLMNTRCAITAVLPVQYQVECLKQLTISELNLDDGELLLFQDIDNTGVINGIVAALVMEDENDPDAIIIKSPLNQLQNKNLPENKSVLISITSEEAFTFEASLHFLRGKPNAGLVPLGMVANDPDDVGRRIKEEYAGSEAGWNTANISAYSNYISDVIFNVPSRYYAKMAAGVVDDQHGVYFMQFSYTSIIGLLNDGEKRVGHADDLAYTWKQEAVSHETIKKNFYLAKDIKKRNQLNRIISNFVKYGNPTPVPEPLLDNISWPKISDSDNMSYLYFGNELLVKQNPKNQHFQFWMDRYEQDGNPTIGL